MQPDKTLKDRVAIVTGGGKGIGRSIALAYAAAGASVVICGRTVSRLEQVSREARETGGYIVPIVTDITSESQVEDLVLKTLQKFGKIDILVNNAGAGGPLDLITGISKEAWDEVIVTNLTGVFLCSRAVLRHMMERRQGNIINLSSGAGRIRNSVRSLPYSVSKYGMEGFTFALAVQMKPYGICVNAIRPGIMDTDIHRNSPPQYRLKMRHPDGVKPLALFLAAQTAETMTGESIELGEWLQGIPSEGR